MAEYFEFFAARMRRQTMTLKKFPRFIGLALVTLYRCTLSPLIGPRCRYLPSCSEYAKEALSHFGLWAGSWINQDGQYER